MRRNGQGNRLRGSSTQLRWWVRVLVLLSALAPIATAHAHEFKPAVLALKEIQPGRFRVQWLPPSVPTGVVSAMRPVFPAHCAVDDGSMLDCGNYGLAGDLTFAPATASQETVNVNITWLTGPTLFRVVTGSPPTLQLKGIPTQVNARQWFSLVGDYVWLGMQHIWGGADHLLFVAGLMLLVRTWKRLTWTVTAFTLAHSITLAAAALNWAHVPTAPVELCIALSVLLLAVEISIQRDTITHRAPWAVAFIFGLLHGLGFASALADVGLPANHVPISLLSFNIGVELGQLAAIVVAAALWRTLVRGRRIATYAEFAAAVALGTSATYWSLERAQVWLTQLNIG